MRSRGLVVAIAVVLAVLAAVGVIVYTNQLEKAVTEDNTVVVVVSTQDIAANTALNSLLDSGGFEPIRVPEAALVQGAVTDLEELRNRVTSAPILANEQIPLSRLGEGTSNNLGISKDHVGLGIQLGGQQSVNGLVQQGDNVAIYASFKRGTAVPLDTLEKILDPADLQAILDQIAGGATPTTTELTIITMPFDFTVSIVQSAKVLSVQNPPVDQASGRQEPGESTLVLDLLPADAQSVVFGSSAPDALGLWLGLLPPENEDGYPTEAVIGPPFAKIVGVGSK